MIRRVAITALIAVFVSAFSATTASAAFVTGGISIAGSYRAVDGGGVIVSDLTLARAADFVIAGTPEGVGTPGVDGSFVVTDATGSFAAVTNGSIKDFTFSGPSVGAGFPVVPVSGFELFAGSGITFNLLTIAIFGPVSPTALTLMGTGNFVLGGDLTPGTITLTFNQTAGTFSFSASQGATTPVPEPGSMMLLGSGLFGLAGAARRRFKRA